MKIIITNYMFMSSFRTQVYSVKLVKDVYLNCSDQTYTSSTQNLSQTISNFNWQAYIGPMHVLLKLTGRFVIY